MNSPVSVDTQEDASAPLNRLLGLVSQDMAEVNRVILDRMQSSVGMIPNLADYLMSAGGKRVRPMLTVAAARMLGYQGGDHVKLAATVEFIHTATLLHDDVVDGSELRRGQAAANRVWSNAASVLVGDFLFARAFNLMVETNSLRVLDILASASSVIAEGEVRQLAAANDIALGREDYHAIIEAKTAALFAAATQVAAVIAQAPAEVEERLFRYGRELGMAFQLVDDALDYGGSQARLGKAVGDDFREGKMTMPVVLAVAAGDSEERRFWARVIEAGDQQDGDLERAIAILGRHGALEATAEAARRHAHTAQDALAGFPPGPYRDALINLADFVVTRAH